MRQRCPSPDPHVQNIFGGLAGLGSVATVQLEWRRADGRPVATAAVRGRGNETETLPLFTNKDSIVGDVSAQILVLNRPPLRATAAKRAGLQTTRTSGYNSPGRWLLAYIRCANMPSVL